MRKRIIAPLQQGTTSSDENWLKLEALVEVEITSEDAAYTIECALLPGRARGGAPQRPDSRRSGFSSPIRNGFGGYC